MAFKLNVGLLAVSLSLSLVNLEGVSAGMATRYWDCCKPSAAWNNKAPVYAPVDVCKADGVTVIDPKAADSGQSGCNGGDQFQCSCMQPFNDTVDNTLAYGFAAFTAGNEESTDCACYLAEIAHDAQGQPIKRNKLIFQVINTGGDVQAENVDVQIPGGGLGAFPQGCPAQWKTPAQQWGETYGGLKDEAGCKNLPTPLQEGCKWRFSSWGDNPVLKGKPQRVKCPKGLIDRSGCQRKDEGQVQAYSGKTDASGKAAEDGYKRNRSVCQGGAKAEGYGADGGDGSQGNKPTTSGSDKDADASGSHPEVDGSSSSTDGSKPESYGANTGGADGNGSSPQPGADGSSQAGKPVNGADGKSPESYAPSGDTAPAADKGHGHHKMHKVCRKSH